MPLYKFGAGDLFYNRIKAHPSSSFFIYNSNIYYNGRGHEKGQFASSVPNVPVGHLNLFEYNVDRSEAFPDVKTGKITIGPSSSVSSSNVPDTGIIFPFVYKGLPKVAFKNITREQYIHDYAPGDVITGSYQLSSSLTRQVYVSSSHNFNDGRYQKSTGHFVITQGSALKNSLDYSRRLGEHYNFISGASSDTTVIQIPSVFYGSEIKKGTVELNYYVTGSSIGILRDSQRNGALIQYSGSSATNNGEIAGVVLYKEGFIILTGSWDLSDPIGGDQLSAKFRMADRDIDRTLITTNPRWTRFGMGTNDNVSPALADLTLGSASFGIDFAGTHTIPTVTMLAHANRGELNHSNNRTYNEYYSNMSASTALTGSFMYSERSMDIKKIHSSSYADPTGSLQKITYITKVGIYDNKKKLIGIASVAKPIKKTEERDLTFKLKLDI